MYLSRVGYYADFCIYPFLAMVLLVAAVVRTAPLAWPELLMGFVAGAMIWTLVEYLFHRFIFHHVPYFERMHDAHHDDPKGLIGTPSFISLTAIGIAVLLPISLATNFSIGSSFTSGFMLGYWVYSGLHHVLHHMTIGPDSYLFAAKRRHALHHYAKESCNFGVSTGFWDRVFGTAFETRSELQRPSPSI